MSAKQSQGSQSTSRGPPGKLHTTSRDYAIPCETHYTIGRDLRSDIRMRAKSFLEEGHSCR
jgi:hypothetical protein